MGASELAVRGWCRSQFGEDAASVIDEVANPWETISIDVASVGCSTGGDRTRGSGFSRGFRVAGIRGWFLSGAIRMTWWVRVFTTGHIG